MVQTGLDVFISERSPSFRGRRVGVVCHPASVDSRLVHIVDSLCASGNRPTRLFGPEHGVRGEAQDMVGVEEEVDRLTGIPVVSLYGNRVESLSPSIDQLKQLDVLVVDLQDVGSRYYTFIWTMALCLEAAAKAGIQVVVLDRPNPIGGQALEGGAVDSAFKSFVGLGSLPVRHGLTIGEVARTVKAGMAWSDGRFKTPLDVDLTVIPMRGWSRSDYFDTTGLPWVLPSPNMPTIDTAVVYPGLCLIEGTLFSEGRGCTRPFEIIGAPYVDGHALATRLGEMPGVRFRPLAFSPTFHKHAGMRCGGIQLHLTDRRAFQPYRTGIAILHALHALCGSDFAWRTERYEFVSDRLAIDLLTGNSQIREGIEGGASLPDLFATFAPEEASFRERLRPHLLY